MKTKLFNAAAAILFGAVVATYAASVQAADSDTNVSNMSLEEQLASNNWSPKNYPNYGDAPIDENLASTYQFTHGDYPMDGLDGGDAD